MNPEQPYVLVLTTERGRRFGIRRDLARVEGDPYVGEPPADAGVPVVEDVDAGTVLGDAGATCDPILVDIDGERHILFAGSQETPEMAFAVVNGNRARVCNGVWMTFPEPFREGMTIEFVALDDAERELFRLDSPPLKADRLVGLFGPRWSGYAPLNASDG